MRWISLLHFYQPANIESEKVLEATKMSYERILRALEQHPEYKTTINLAGCLVERWVSEFNRTDLIERFSKLLEKKQIELVGSAAYHCLLPLVSEKEAERQIKEQEEILKKYFGKSLKLRGFFLPELAYSPKMARIIKKLGYQWVVLDQIALGGLTNESPTAGFIDKSSGLEVVLRSRIISESYIPDTLNLICDNQFDETIVTACDAELLGLRHIDHTAEYEKLLKNKSLKTSTVTDFLKTQKKKKIEKFIACSWQSTETELANNVPYALWYNPKMIIHVKLWELANLVQQLEQKFVKDQNIKWSRWHLVRGLESCVWWWSSKKDFSEVFGPIAWNPDEIERGINELIRAVRTLHKSIDKKVLLSAEKLALDIRWLIWKEHWK